MSKNCETCDNGWSPILALESYEGQYYLKVVNWKGGTGCKPAFPVYLGEYGYVYNIAEAQPINGIGGPQGFQGVQGPQGNEGAVGSQGPQGTQAVGTQGPQGEMGLQGQRGYQGTQGFQGPQGLRGYQGPRGVQGDQGIQGNTGDQGNQGLQGVTGLQGHQGNQGDQGEIGPQGVEGAQGPQGNQGNTGVQGSQGAQGAQGASGGENEYGATLTLFYHNANYVLYNQGISIYSPRLGGELWGISAPGGMLINRAFLRITVRGSITKNTSQNPTLYLQILQGGSTQIQILNDALVEASGSTTLHFETVLILKGLNGLFRSSRKTTVTQGGLGTSIKTIVTTGTVLSSVDFRNSFQLRMNFDVSPDSNNSYLIDDVVIEQATFQYEENEE